jgi:hypothetical protein
MQAATLSPRFDAHSGRLVLLTSVLSRLMVGPPRTRAHRFICLCEPHTLLPCNRPKRG